MSYLKFFLTVLKHKWFVFWIGIKLKVPVWRLLIHDWTKFLPSEFPHYRRKFYSLENDPEGWNRAWLHHQNSNPHHWEYWIPRSGQSQSEKHVFFDGTKPLIMPEWAVREMVADWLAAARVYEGQWPDFSNWQWLKENRSRFILHQKSAEYLDQIFLEAEEIFSF